MSKVGVCRVSTIFILLFIMLAVVIYGDYECYDDYDKLPLNLKIACCYVLPALLGICLLLLLPSYISCILIKPRPIPEEYTLTTVEIAKFLVQPHTQNDFRALAEITRQYTNERANLNVWERDYRHGGLRVCEKCSIIKPDRSHHCNYCHRCVIKMDHHCHWVNNCIHADNYKYFIQTITYGLLVTIIIFTINIINVAVSGSKADQKGNPKYYPLYVAAAIGGLVFLFLAFLMLDHCINLFRGQTSYERMYDREHYNRGCNRNFTVVMGRNLCEWTLPYPSSEFTSEYDPLISSYEDPSTQSPRRISSKSSKEESRNIDNHLAACSLEDTLSMNYNSVPSGPRSPGKRHPHTQIKTISEDFNGNV